MSLAGRARYGEASTGNELALLALFGRINKLNHALRRNLPQGICRSIYFYRRKGVALLFK